MAKAKVKLLEPTLDSLLEARNLTRKHLEVECPDGDCNQIALKLSRWRELCPFIGLGPEDEEDIAANYTKFKEKKIGMFRVWREKLASEATYLRLAKGLEELKLRNIIINLLDLYSAQSQSVRQAQQVETNIPRLDDKPKPHQIIRIKGRSGREVVIRDQLASHWEDLLIQLSFEPPSSASYMIKNINRNCRGEVEEACREVLLKWLSGHPSSCQPVTWRSLIEVIKALDHCTLAAELEAELLP